MTGRKSVVKSKNISKQIKTKKAPEIALLEDINSRLGKILLVLGLMLPKIDVNKTTFILREAGWEWNDISSLLGISTKTATNALYRYTHSKGNPSS